MTAYEFALGRKTGFASWKKNNLVGESFFDIIQSQKDKFVPIRSPLETEYLQKFFAVIDKGLLRLDTPPAKNGNIDNRKFFSEQILKLRKSGDLPLEKPNSSLNPDLIPGDILLVPAAHAAIYIDKGLYFEATAFGSTGEGGFRFVTFANMRSKYDASLIQTFSHVRPTGTIPLPEEFVVYLDGKKLEIHVFKIEFDKGQPFLVFWDLFL